MSQTQPCIGEILIHVTYYYVDKGVKTKSCQPNCVTFVSHILENILLLYVLRKYEIKHLCPDSSRYFCQSEITEIDLMMYCIFYLHDEKCYKPMHKVLFSRFFPQVVHYFL